MAGLIDAQIQFMLWMQEFHTPALGAFFKGFTFFGGEGYLLLVPLALWCLDYRTGLKISALMAATLFVNTTLKNWAQEPRPYEIDPRIVSAGEQGFSFPSGHAMLVVAYWGLIADWVERRAFWWIAFAVMLVMATSRVYLGVHFPIDVAVGLLLGGALLVVFVRKQGELEAWFAAHPLGRQVGLACAAGGVLLVFDLLLVPDPLHEHLNVGAAGFLAGAGAGGALGLRTLSFNGGGIWWKRVLRFVVGMLLTGGLLAGMRQLGVPPGTFGDLVPAAYLAIFGAWMTFAMPWLFERVRLSD